MQTICKKKATHTHTHKKLPIERHFIFISNFILFSVFFQFLFLNSIFLNSIFIFNFFIFNFYFLFSNTTSSRPPPSEWYRERGGLDHHLQPQHVRQPSHQTLSAGYGMVDMLKRKKKELKMF